MLDPRWSLRWAWHTLVANPTAWGLGAVALVVVPLLEAARGVGLAARDTDLPSLAGDSTWLCALLGATLALASAESGRFLLERTEHAARTLAEFTLVATAAALLGGACAVGTAWVEPRAGLAAAGLALKSAFHLGACGALLLRLPGPVVLRPVLLLTSLLLLPALLQSTAPAVDVLQGVLAPAASGSLGATLAAGGALILAALLVPAPRSTVL